MGESPWKFESSWPHHSTIRQHSAVSENPSISAALVISIDRQRSLVHLCNRTKVWGEMWGEGMGNLTAISVKAALSRPGSYQDGDGLFLKVRSNQTGGAGSAQWFVRIQKDGTRKDHNIGSASLLSLADARDAAREKRKAVKVEGRDVARERLLEKIEAQSGGNKFATVAADYIRVKYVESGKAKATIDKQYFFLSKLLPAIGEVALADIRPVEIMTVLRKLETKGQRQTAKCTRAFASRVFRYGVGLGKCEGDPAALLAGNLASPIVVHRAAITDPKRLGDFLRAADAYHGQAVVRIAALLLPHVMTRPGELRNATWDEINWDDAIWHVPAERTKMRRPHDVPLSTQAIALLRQLQALTGSADWILRGQGKKGPISENTLNQAYRRMGFAGSEVTAHGFRTTASTALNESGKWQPDAIERALAHGASNAVRGIYNRSTYWQERLLMMQWWSDYLDTLRAGAVVLPFDSGKQVAR